MAAVKALHKTRFPGESSEYRRARNRLLTSEIELRKRIEAVAAQRRKLPDGGAVSTDYVFEASRPDYSGSETVRLSELFAPRKNTLFLYNFMFPERVGSLTPCPSCTSIIDAIDGAAQHVEQRINFAVIAKAPLESNERALVCQTGTGSRHAARGFHVADVEHVRPDSGGPRHQMGTQPLLLMVLDLMSFGEE